MSNELFELAARAKWRFPSVQGDLNVENLFDLPLKTTRNNQADLNSIAQALDSQLKTSEKPDFVSEVIRTDVETRGKFDLVLYIISVKKEEAAKARKAAERKARREEILAALAKKQGEQLEKATVEDLTAELAKLDEE
jgi:hypothetical protein